VRKVFFEVNSNLEEAMAIERGSQIEVIYKLKLSTVYLVVGVPSGLGRVFGWFLLFPMF